MVDLEKNRAPLLYHVKLCASFQSHLWIQTLAIVRKRSNRVKNCDFFPHVTSKLEGRPWKIIEHLLELYYAKLCASLQIHQWIKSWVTVQKRSIQVKIGDFFVPCDLIIWQMTLKNNRAPLLGCFNLCALFHFIAISEFKQELQSGNGGGGGGGGGGGAISLDLQGQI